MVSITEILIFIMKKGNFLFLVKVSLKPFKEPLEGDICEASLALRKPLKRLDRNSTLPSAILFNFPDLKF